MKSAYIYLPILAASIVLLSACGEETMNAEQKSMKQETALEHAQKHLDENYVCPMHPQIVRDKPGNCPICGMDLVKVETEEQPAKSKEKKILYWVAPMDPNYRSDKPGKSPMGMDLIPVYEEETDGEVADDGPTVKISPSIVNNMGVRTAKLKSGQLSRNIKTVGYVDFDEDKISHVHLRTDGWIERLAVKSVGEHVKQGELLFKLYSPTLVNAQEEYLQSLRSGNKALTSASYDRLVALGFKENQIKQLKKQRRVKQTTEIYAAQDGIVAKLNVREGMYVQPKTEIMALADLSSVWVLADVYEQQVGWVRVGDQAEVRLSYVPGKQLNGTVEYIYPNLDAKTRTLKVRLRFDNPDETLKPNMYADVRIFGEVKKDALLLPHEALIRTGESERVIIVDGKGRFKPRKVTTGIESGDYVEVIEGLQEDDKVVVSGQFLIDSEASLKASLMRMTETKTEMTAE